LGIRDNYLNVYWRGCSLFKIERDGETLKFSTHPKYLVDPDLSKPVAFDGSDFRVQERVQEIAPLIEKYEGPKTLDKMKRAAKSYSGEEKEGVHALACVRGNNVIDTEIAFDRETEGDHSKSTQRVDLACLEDVQGSIRLRFWEAKLYENKELRAAGGNEPRVVKQVSRYRAKLEEHRDEVIKSYGKVARNLVDIARWAGIPEKFGNLVGRVAGGEPFVLDDPPFVGLAIYGFDAEQKKSERWEKHLNKLKDNDTPVLALGDPKGMKLDSTRALKSSAAQA
jgi:hypothetical protein